MRLAGALQGMAKGEVAAWWGENSKEAYSSGLANLATALSKSDSQTGTARIRSATVTHRRGPWLVSSVEATRYDPAPARPDSAVGWISV